KLDGSRVGIARFAREPHGRFAHRTPQFGCQEWGRRFFEDFLVPALDRAFAFSEVHDVAEGVAEYLNFNVTRSLAISFEINARIAKRVERFRGGVPPRGGHLAGIGDQAHAFSAATRHGLEQHGIAKLLRDASGILW